MERNIYSIIDNKPYFKVRKISFEGVKGMALSQHTKNSEHLHDIYERSWYGKRPLEISRASISETGKKLSAFNLSWHRDENDHSVEQIFQASKTFEKGGPFTDVLDKKPNTAKKDPRFRNSGPLKCFTFDGDEYSLQPKGAFYNWIYIQALITNPDLSKEILEYDSFTDIFFNPGKQINCQAEACAMYVGLVQSGKLSDAMRSYDDFLKIVYQKF